MSLDLRPNTIASPPVMGVTEFSAPTGGTKVTETFDWSTAISPRCVELMKYPEKHPRSMEQTRERLAEHVEESTDESSG